MNVLELDFRASFGDRPIPPGALAPASGRWTPRAKAYAVLAAETGQCPRAALLEALAVSPEEFTSWRRHFLRHGPEGLRETRLQRYRR